ncbi:MAG: hypothetical protein ACK55I_08760, partial [bacterium]
PCLSDVGPRSSVFESVSMAFYAPGSIGLIIQHGLPETGVYVAWLLGRETPASRNAASVAPLPVVLLELVLAFVVDYAAQAGYLRALFRGPR